MQDIVSSVLTKDPVIQASRSFVCIRPLTYENEWEAGYLKKVLSRRGNLENTVFAIMDPKATSYLAQPSRMPYLTFPGSQDDASIMGRGMKSMASKFTPSASSMPIPFHTNLRYAMNVGACDRRPVVMLLGSTETKKATEQALASLAWSDSFQGQFSYAKDDDSTHMKHVTEIPDKACLVVVQPDQYGVKGKVLASATSNDQASLTQCLKEGMQAFAPWSHNHQSHLGYAVRNGIRWVPKIPVEDQKSVGATKRLWGDP